MCPIHRNVEEDIESEKHMTYQLLEPGTDSCLHTCLGVISGASKHLQICDTNKCWTTRICESLNR
jgi:hypothetical protein